MKTVHSIMTPHPTSVFVADTLQAAYQKMRGLKVRHLLVVDAQNKLVGILSDRDFQRVMVREKISLTEESYTFDTRETVEDIMTWPVRIVQESTSVKSAAQIMLTEKLSALVVTTFDHHPKGIVTTDDMLRYLVQSDDDHFERPILIASTHL